MFEIVPGEIEIRRTFVGPRRAVALRVVTSMVGAGRHANAARMRAGDTISRIPRNRREESPTPLGYRLAPLNPLAI